MKKAEYIVGIVDGGKGEKTMTETENSGRRGKEKNRTGACKFIK